MFKRSSILVVVLAMLCVVSVASLGQDAPLISEQVQETAASALDQSLTYIDSAANYLGQGVLYLLNMITDDRVSSDLEKPIGYLALITLILILFGLLDFARRVIWIGIIVGWVLLIVRIVLDALNI
jgi:predicted NBD/HSP70 family sugar kinase